jgi:hypothetical protein
VYFEDQTISFTARTVNYNLVVPDGVVTYSASATFAWTMFDTVNNRWMTTVPLSLNKTAFLAGVEFQVPAGGFPGSVHPVTWSGNFFSNTPGVSSVGRQWAAAVYKSFNTNYGSLGVKAVDGNASNLYLNADLAGTPENYKTQVVKGATGTGGMNYTGTFSPASPLLCGACLR